ncbi:MAG: hypothetical protein KC506_02065, partial [Nanoarchaeota archaeon]|nr:hypothetical protein [Nanoarchaeota archaeon]
SSSFAVNYLRDEYIKGELQNSNIQSEEECISGSANPATLLNPNIQAGVEETINPAIYNRGVTRICATGNPGLGTDPGRFVKVGICDSSGQIGCWLDSQSVDRALTDGNVGARNETLSVLNNITNQYLDNEQGYVSRDEAQGALNGFESELTKLNTLLQNKEDITSRANSLLESIELYEDKIFYNAQKAHLLVVKGDVYRLWALQERAKEDSVKQQSSSAGSSSAGGASGSDSNNFERSDGFFGDDMEGYNSNGLIVKREKENVFYYPIYYQGVRTDYLLVKNEKGSENPASLHKVVGESRPIIGFVNSNGLIEISGDGDVEIKGISVQGWEEFSKVGLDSGAVNSERVSSTGGDIKWTYETALKEIVSKTGDYGNNKEFVNQIHDAGLLTDDQFKEIKGGWFGIGEENMDYVHELLIQNQAKEFEKTNSEKPIVCENHLECFNQGKDVFCNNGVCSDVGLEYAQESVYYLGFLEEVSGSFKEVAPESTITGENDFYLAVGHTCNILEATIVGGKGTFGLSEFNNGVKKVKLNNLVDSGKVTAVVKCGNNAQTISINVNDGLNKYYYLKDGGIYVGLSPEDEDSLLIAYVIGDNIRSPLPDIIGGIGEVGLNGQDIDMFEEKIINNYQYRDKISMELLIYLDGKSVRDLNCNPSALSGCLMAPKV